MTNPRHTQLLVLRALTFIGAAGSKGIADQSNPFGIDASRSVLPFLLRATGPPTSQLSTLALRSDQRHLQNVTDDTAYNDDVSVDDASLDNATFSELCPTVEAEIDRLFQGLYKCDCDEFTISVACSTPTALPVQGAPNLKALVNNTVFFDDGPNATLFYDGVLNIAHQDICFDYRYVVPPEPQTEFPPEGCFSAVYSDDGRNIESCSATLTDGNNTLKNCSSCSGCSGGVKITIDCSNINELAVTDRCYSLDGTETEEIFPALVKSIGGGSASITTSLRFGYILLLGQAAMLMSGLFC